MNEADLSSNRVDIVVEIEAETETAEGETGVLTQRWEPTTGRRIDAPAGTATRWERRRS